jgi:glutaredoxin
MKLLIGSVAIFILFFIILWQVHFKSEKLRSSMIDTRARIILYTKPGCHLCEVMREQIHAAGCEDEYTLEEVNIESDPELFVRYRTEIPVLTINGVEAFRHRLDARKFKLKLRALQPREGRDISSP